MAYIYSYAQFHGERSIEAKGNRILITGFPGCGKTTLLKRLFEDCPSLCGFWTEEIKQGGVRRGFQIVTTWGNRLILAQKDLSSSPYRVGAYGLYLENLERISAILLQMAEGEKRSYLIDEIGRMEYFSPTFRKLINFLFAECDSNLLATIALRDFHPDISRFKKKGSVYHLKLESFNQIYAQIREKIETWSN